MPDEHAEPFGEEVQAQITKEREENKKREQARREQEPRGRVRELFGVRTALGCLLFVAIALTFSANPNPSSESVSPFEEGSCALHSSFEGITEFEQGGLPSLLEYAYGKGRTLSRSQVRHLYNCLLSSLKDPYLDYQKTLSEDVCTHAEKGIVDFRKVVKMYVRTRGSWLDEFATYGRDLIKYGSSEGASFSYLVERTKSKFSFPGNELDDEDACRQIIKTGPDNTNKAYNAAFDYKPTGKRGPWL